MRESQRTRHYRYRWIVCKNYTFVWCKNRWKCKLKLIPKLIGLPALTQLHHSFGQSYCIKLKNTGEQSKLPIFEHLHCHPSFASMKIDPFISLISFILPISVSSLLIGLATQPPLMETSSELTLTNLNSSQPEIASTKPVHSGIHLIWVCISLVDMRRTKWSLLGWSRKWRELRLSPCPASEKTQRYSMTVWKINKCKKKKQKVILYKTCENNRIHFSK